MTRNPLLIQHRFQAFATTQAVYQNQYQAQNYYWQRRNNNNSGFNFMYLAAPVAVLLFLKQKSNENYSQCEASRADKIRGAYENKIRFFAPPEKMFEIFATQRTKDGELVMSYADFLRTITPYNFGEIPSDDFIQGYVDKNAPEIFKLVDANKDGQISFTEFFFFMLLLQIPPAKLRKRFKKFPGEKMTKEEFSVQIREMRKNSAIGKKQ